jgi:hypothetical protein
MWLTCCGPPPFPAWPATPYRLALLPQDLSFVVKNNRKGPDGKRGDVALVNKVSGWFEPGQMSALVGGWPWGWG